jgi:16S rRNA (cytosine1402-N4)-methyltransferase
MKKIKRWEIHKPVLLEETIDYLAIKKGGKYIDATVGLGGHAERIVKLGGQLLGIDCDNEVLEIAKERLELACPDAPWQLIKGNFSEIEEIAEKHRFVPVDGILFDLGISTYHYQKAKRGFSFKDNFFLDLRISKEKAVTAFDIVNQASREELAELLAKTVQERLADEIACACIKSRRKKPIKTAADLAKLVEGVYQHYYGRRKRRLHPATKVFLALRIAVNKEFENLRKGLVGAVRILSSGGRLAVISFHSGEDRLVKQFFKSEEKQGKLNVLTKRGIYPSREEIVENSAARSAVLRVAER